MINIEKSFSNENNGVKATSFHRRTCVKMYQIPKRLLNGYFTKAMIQPAAIGFILQKNKTIKWKIAAYTYKLND